MICAAQTSRQVVSPTRPVGSPVLSHKLAGVLQHVACRAGAAAETFPYTEAKYRRSLHDDLNIILKYGTRNKDDKLAQALLASTTMILTIWSMWIKRERLEKKKSKTTSDRKR
jgi:hypothetical protein